MNQVWKSNWAQTREHFEAWWKHEGLVFGAWGTGLPTTREHERIDEPSAPAGAEAQQTDAQYIARNVRYKMAHRAWPGDILPAAWPHGGTLPLATYLGATPRYAPTNIWYEPCMSDLRSHPPLRFDPEHPQCRQLETIVRQAVELSRGNYFVGMPALLGGLDILAELRGTGDLLMEMIEDPPGVHQRLREIQDAYVPAFNRMYDILKLEDGSMCFGYFMLWGPGKTGLCQCDTAAMFSAEMFGEFVIPYLREQCAFLDQSMFHIDGAQCLIHLDQLLEIEDLDAIEYTPDPKSPGGGDPHWFELYRRILRAGKSLWVANLRKEQVVPVLDAIGGEGVYVSVNGLTEADGEALAGIVDGLR
jgi:hypothetical protein